MMLTREIPRKAYEVVERHYKDGPSECDCGILYISAQCRCKNPEDGQLLDKRSAKYPYAGFHREKLDGSITLKVNEKLAIVVEESVVENGEKLYEFAVNTALTKEAAKAQEQTDYGVAVVNEGESFFYTDGKWADWTVALKILKENKDFSDYVMDNFSIKAYLIAK